MLLTGEMLVRHAGMRIYEDINILLIDLSGSGFLLLYPSPVHRVRRLVGSAAIEFPSIFRGA